MVEKKTGKPRGRPPMDCDVINDKTFQRKKEATIKKAQAKKCASRVAHPVKPCAMKNGKCASSASAEMKKKSCADVKSKPLSAFGNKTEQMTEMKSRCSAMSKELKNVTCTVPRRKNGRLTCHNPAAKAKKAEGIYIVGMGKY